MQSKGLATFIWILYVQIIRGQQNGLVNNQNIDTISIVSQQQPLQTTTKSEFTNQNVARNNQHQVQMQINMPPQVLNAEYIQQPPDVQQPPLLQQFLLPQQPLKIKQSLRLQPPIQQTLPAAHSSQSHNHSPVQQTLQAQQSFHLQQPIDVQQNVPQQKTNYQQKVNLGQIADLGHKNNFQSSHDAQLNLKLVPTNLQQPQNTNNFHIQTQQNSRPVEIVTNLQQTDGKSLDVSTMRYLTPSQLSTPSSPTNAAAVSHNPSIAFIPSYSSNSVDQTYIPSYNYIKPSVEIQPNSVERMKAINSGPALSSVLTIPSSLFQNSNTQKYYYNPQIGDPRQNVHFNENLGFQYPQQSPISIIAIHSQPTATAIPNQSSILSSIPLSLIGTPSVFPQYAVSPTYPLNTVMAPAYVSPKSKSSNLKSFLPLIFNLLKEKIASSVCCNSCPDECNKDSNKKLEVSSGYSSKKHYGALNDDVLFIPENVSEVSDAGCLRERKNCVKIEKDQEDSEETQEDEDSDEKENEGDDDDDDED